MGIGPRPLAAAFGDVGLDRHQPRGLPAGIMADVARPAVGEKVATCWRMLLAGIGCIA